MPFGGQLIAQGATASLQEMSIHGLLTPFRRESPAEGGMGHPSRGSQARPILEPLLPANGHLYHNDQPAALPGVCSRLPSRPGTPSNRPSSAPQRPRQPGSRPRGAPHLSGAVRPLGARGTAQSPRRRDTETRREKPSPPLALRSALTGRRRLLVGAAVS